MYFFQNYDNKNRLPLNDRAYKIILNTKCSREKVPERLRAFFDYINDPKTVSKDGFIERLEDRVRKYNTDEWRRNLMTLEELMERNHKIGYEKGHAEGKLEIAKSMAAKGFGFDVIEELTGISEGELRKMQGQTSL
ncbi:MAG: hypothetical protein IKL72_00250 [Firmicutes bacterium]|nr:hypothetical protein [Bacillota bacterium]